MISGKIITVSIVAGLIASVLSYCFNSRALKILGDGAVTYGAPIFEECLKTGLALFLGGSVILTHMTFGVVEALYDFYKNKGLIARLSAGAGFLSHSLFGIITVLASRAFNTPISGLVLALAAHIIWNYWVTNIR